MPAKRFYEAVARASGIRDSIIVVSAHLRVEPQAILQMGVKAILPKPFHLPELIDLIEHVSP